LQSQLEKSKLNIAVHLVTFVTLKQIWHCNNNFTNNEMLSFNMKLTMEFKESKCFNDGIFPFWDEMDVFNKTIFSCGNP
jgi:hypothetical protein